MAKRKPHGHFCKICGEYKANEKFSGKGHAAHICKACSKLSPEKRSELMAIRRLLDLPWQLTKEQRDWLEKCTHDKRTEVRELAQEQYNLRFRRTGYSDNEADDFDESDTEDFIGEETELPF